MSRRKPKSSEARSAAAQNISATAPAWAPLVAILGALSWTFRTDVAGSDLWWHLASGRDIWQRGSVPSTDAFSHTFAGEPWMNHEWLWDVIFWAAYRVDPQAPAWLNVLIVAAVLCVVLSVARRASGSVLAAGAALWMAAATAYWFIDIRPHLVTLLLVAIVMRTRDSRAALWLWPGLMLAWVNLHAGFVFGLGAVGLHAVIETLERSHAARQLRMPAREWLAVGACLLAWLANPWGWHILEYPLAYLTGDTPYRTLIEWHRTPFGFDPRHFEARFWACAAVAIVGAALSVRRRRYPVALASVTLAMAITSRRFIPLFLVTAAPLMAIAFAALQERWFARRPALTTATASSAAALAGAALALVLVFQSYPRDDLLTRWTAQREFPHAAVTYLEATGARRILNHYSWGGYLMLHAPETTVFIDGRANTLYDDPFYARYRELAAGRGLEFLDRYTIDAALLRHGPLATALRRAPHHWKPIYDDASAIILVPPRERETDWPDATRLLAEDPEWLLRQAWHARADGEYERGLSLARKAIESQPLLIPAYGALALIHAERGDYDLARSEIDAAIATAPRYRERLRAMEANAYERVGAYEQALVALRASVPSGPFLQRDQTYERIEKIERKLGLRR